MICACCQKPMEKICSDCRGWVLCHSPCRVRFCTEHQWGLWLEHAASCAAKITYDRLTGMKVADPVAKPDSSVTCDRCKCDFTTDSMVYWLIGISGRPILRGRGELGVAAPKFCRTCAQFVKQDLGQLLGDLHLTV
jgi:hypothetical protein